MQPRILRTPGGGSDLCHPGLLVRNLWNYRTLLWFLLVRNLRSQYKKSLVGYLWILLNPLIQLLVYSFVFSNILKVPGQDGVPFPLFVLIGLVPFVFLSNAIMSATDSISASGSLVTMVYFPREVLTAAAVLTRVVDLLAGMIILVAVLAISGTMIGWAMLWMIPGLLILLLLVLGLAFPLAVLNLFFHDVRFLVNVALNLWFFLTPIMYPLQAVPHEYRWVFDLNPMSHLVAAYRCAILENVSPPLGNLGIATGISLVVVIAGFFLFKKVEPVFADNI